MDLFFVDDAQQKSPSRPGMGPLLAVGGVRVPEQSIQDLERQTGDLCEKYSFPDKAIFKWSPGRELWMSKNLVDERRQEFFMRVLGLAQENGAAATVIIEDTNRATAMKTESHEIDAIQLFLERAHNQLVSRQCIGMVIVSQPSGDRKSESKFLASCLETLKCGTDYVRPDRVAAVLCSPPRFLRLLQIADLVTSCTTAFVSGEDSYSPPVFDIIKTMLAAELGRIGGVGLKIHPDYRYANLYHWLLGDTHFWRRSTGLPLPLAGRSYFSGPSTP